MKKVGFFTILLIVFNITVFGQQSDSVREEVDYLLFLPNSSNQFADEGSARVQLDNTARYLRSKELQDTQIFVYGYAADVANDINPNQLSVDRARHVINELVKRGIESRFFANPVGYGSVNTWGNNTDENARSPNRRVRILFQDIVITPEIVQEAEEEILAYEAQEYFDEYDDYGYFYDDVFFDNFNDESALQDDTDQFIWYWLLLLLLPLLLLLWPRKKTKKPKAVKEVSAQPKPQVETQTAPEPAPQPEPVQEPISEPAPVTAEPVTVSAAPVIAAVAATPVMPEGGEPKYYRLTEEEIRNLAYELYEQRCHEHGYHDQDWHSAINMLFAKYEAQGYIVLWP